jgi:transposase-like protein
MVINSAYLGPESCHFTSAAEHRFTGKKYFEFSKMPARKSYNKAFKEEAGRLAEKSGVTQVASDLGIHPNMIYIWKKQLAKNAHKAF